MTVSPSLFGVKTLYFFRVDHPLHVELSDSTIHKGIIKHFSFQIIDLNYLIINYFD